LPKICGARYAFFLFIEELLCEIENRFVSLWVQIIKREKIMATMTIEYNEKNKHVMQVLTGLIGTGIIHRTNETKISSFKTALYEAKTMSKNIAQNGIAGYKTLDDLLNEE